MVGLAPRTGSRQLCPFEVIMMEPLYAAFHVLLCKARALIQDGTTESPLAFTPLDWRYLFQCVQPHQWPEIAHHLMQLLAEHYASREFFEFTRQQAAEMLPNAETTSTASQSPSLLATLAPDAAQAASSQAGGDRV